MLELLQLNTPDILHGVAEAVGLATVAVALSKNQRLAIIERDGGEPQMRHYSEEQGWFTGGYCNDPCTHLQVHHIETQRQGGTNDPLNLITLAQCEHTGVCPTHEIIDGLMGGKFTNDAQFVVHPDIREATMHYNGDASVFANVFAQRDEAIANGQSYINEGHNLEMLETAYINTMNAIAQGWSMPEVKHRR